MGRPKTLRSALPAFRRILKQFGPYIRKQRMLIGGATVGLFAELAFRLLEPWPLKIVFDHVIAPIDGGGFSVFGRSDAMSLLVFSAIAVVGIAGLRALAAYGTAIGFALVGNRVLTDVRNDLYAHLQRLSLSFHARASSGDLVVRVIGDVSLVKDVTVTALLPLAGSFLMLTGMVGVMFWLHWQLTLVSLAVVPLFWIAATRIGRRVHEVSRTQRHREGQMAARAAESIGAIGTVRALSLEPLFGRMFTSQNARSLTEGVRAKRLEARLERSVDLLIAIATALVLAYGALLVLRRALTVGELLVFLTYFKTAFRPIRDFAKYTGRLARGTAAGERVLELLERVPDVHDLPGATPAPAFSGAVRFEHVSFCHEGNHRVLHDMTFEVTPGQQVAVVGPSGSGKSTLVGLLLRLYDPQDGAVLIDGRDIRTYTVDSVRSQTSIVLQDTLLFAASIRDNIAYGAPNATAAAVETAARLARAHEFIVAMPEGYDTVLGERGVTLSAGQRQRIALARAAVRQAAMIILDEPTRGLDERSEAAVVEAFASLARGRTTFLVTHDLRLAVSADLILYVDGGRLLEAGTHDELMRAAGPYAATYTLQTGRRAGHTASDSYAVIH